jgi:hypothetical protein
MLFVQSAIDWVNDRESNTIVVIPEAWEFIPEAKGSPVKASAIALVRKGSGIGNHIWVDSQDMAGVDKTILRGCPVWLIGVQRESNEIKRNLENIPKGIKRPTAAQIALLERGQFYACWGSNTIKTYVQPSWMKSDEAREIAQGGVQRTVPPTRKTVRESTVTEEEARELREENANLKRRVEDLLNELNRVPAIDREASTPSAAAPVRRHPADIELPSVPLNGDGEAIYQFVKQRLALEAPGIIKLLTIKPELEVQVQRKTLSLDGGSLKGRVAAVIAKGFLKESQRHADVKRELERTGASVNSGNLTTTLKDLVRDGFLTNEGDGYKEVPEMRVRIVEA